MFIITTKSSWLHNYWSIEKRMRVQCQIACFKRSSSSPRGAKPPSWLGCRSDEEAPMLITSPAG